MEADIHPLCKKLGISAASFYLAAAYLTLSAYNANKKVYICTVSNGRGNLKTSDSFGMFVNTLALKGDTEEAIELTERGLPLSANEKQKATLRAALCFLYLKAGREDKAVRLAAELPHTRESREVILPLVQQGLSSSRIDENIRTILLGD